MSQSRHVEKHPALNLWRIIADSQEFAPVVPPVHQSLVRSVDPTCHGLTSRTIDLVDVPPECHSLFLWSTNTHFCLQLFQELFKSTVNSESFKITSHPEVFSRPASETRNQSRNEKAMITWVRASLVHEDIKLRIIKELCVSIPSWHSRGIVIGLVLLQDAFDQLFQPWFQL